MRPLPVIKQISFLRYEKTVTERGYSDAFTQNGGKARRLFSPAPGPFVCSLSA